MRSEREEEDGTINIDSNFSAAVYKNVSVECASEYWTIVYLPAYLVSKVMKLVTGLQAIVSLSSSMTTLTSMVELG